MKNKKISTFIVAAVMAFCLAACSNDSGTSLVSSTFCVDKIYLYGEQHGDEAILNKELEIWHDYYYNDGMRHLFLETPYYTAEFLNIWMQADNDVILNAVYDDWEGTASHTPVVKEFYKQLKADCPETILHGTDVGHQYDTIGKRYIEYLEQNNMEKTENYLLAKEAIEQGKFYYKNDDSVYRENKMTENLIREFDALDGENIMGIFGSAHTGLDSMDFTGAVPCMATQLKEHYGDIIISEDLSWIRADVQPSRIDSIEISGKSYTASYFGRQDLSGFKDYSHREYWRLENAYDDFKDNPKPGDVLPYDNYPMAIEAGQVFVTDYTKIDGSVTRLYYRSDGNDWEGTPTTEQFAVSN